VAAVAAALVLVMLQVVSAGTPTGIRVKPVSVATAVLVTASRAHAWAPGVPAAPRGWTTQFSDGFKGRAGTAPNSTTWQYVTRADSSETATMTNSARNGSLDGAGHLDLTPWRYGGSWTSAKLKTTSPNVGAPPGGDLEVTAGIQQPNPAGGLGYWPAFWMIGPGHWPESGEIDIMEDVDARSELSGTVHCGSYPGGPCRTQGTGSGLVPCPGCQTGYHTYTMVLDRTHPADESITFYLDAKPYFTVRERQIGTSVWRAAFDHRMSIILELAMGGGYPDQACECSTPTPSTTPGSTMRVNYVAAYTTGS
jgi:beta-glucanase (GH16 family)